MNIFASVLIAVYNEKSSILNILKKLQLVFQDRGMYEIIVINDCSNDGTWEILESNTNLYNKLINNDANMGKGACIKKGLENSKGKYIFFQDADNEYDPKDFIRFFDVIDNFDPDLIIGSRFKFPNYIRSHYFINKLANFILTNFFNILYNTTFTDIYSCYAVFKKNLIVPSELKTEGFEQHAEILCKITKKATKLYEVPINYNGRTYEQGKKIKYSDFFKVVYQILKMRFF